jgi:methionyl-tRNA synthetase
MALSLPLPKRILTHAHWTLGKEKMAKSTGNVVNPFFALDRFGVDVMRFYLAHDGGLSHDADYSNYHIIERYKKALNGSLGNLASRFTRGKGWNVRRAVETLVGSTSVKDQYLATDQLALDHFNLLVRTPYEVKESVDKMDVKGALKTTMHLVYTVSSLQQHSLIYLIPFYLDKFLPPSSYPLESRERTR